MAKITYDYTAAEIQADITAGRDFELEHNEDRIVIEIPKGLLNMVLRPEDGVLMASDHRAKLEDYLHIIAENQAGNKVLAMLRVKGSMSGTGVRGMKGNQINALLSKGSFVLKDINDPDIQSEYFPEPEENIKKW